jgi:hypothetical protein
MGKKTSKNNFIEFLTALIPSCEFFEKNFEYKKSLLFLLFNSYFFTSFIVWLVCFSEDKEKFYVREKNYIIHFRFLHFFMCGTTKLLFFDVFFFLTDFSLSRLRLSFSLTLVHIRVDVSIFSSCTIGS